MRTYIHTLGEVAITVIATGFPFTSFTSRSDGNVVRPGNDYRCSSWRGSNTINSTIDLLLHHHHYHHLYYHYHHLYHHYHQHMYHHHYMISLTLYVQGDAVKKAAEQVQNQAQILKSQLQNVIFCIHQHHYSHHHYYDHHPHYHIITLSSPSSQ